MGSTIQTPLQAVTIEYTLEHFIEYQVAFNQTLAFKLTDIQTQFLEPPTFMHPQK